MRNTYSLSLQILAEHTAGTHKHTQTHTDSKVPSLTSPIRRRPASEHAHWAPRALPNPEGELSCSSSASLSIPEVAPCLTWKLGTLPPPSDRLPGWRLREQLVVEGSSPARSAACLNCDLRVCVRDRDGDREESSRYSNSSSDKAVCQVSSSCYRRPAGRDF